jgi:hypothetical protein
LKPVSQNDPPEISTKSNPLKRPLGREQPALLKVYESQRHGELTLSVQHGRAECERDGKDLDALDVSTTNLKKSEMAFSLTPKTNDEN